MNTRITPVYKPTLKLITTLITNLQLEEVIVLLSKMCEGRKDLISSIDINGGIIQSSYNSIRNTYPTIQLLFEKHEGGIHVLVYSNHEVLTNASSMMGLSLIIPIGCTIIFAGIIGSLKNYDIWAFIIGATFGVAMIGFALLLRKDTSNLDYTLDKVRLIVDALHAGF